MPYTIIRFLDDLSHEIENFKARPEHLRSSASSNGFEKLVREILEESSVFKNNAKLKTVLNFGHYFPDIDVYINEKRYGVELKSRTDGSWINNGGSVFESISDINYEEIYVLFGTISKKKEEEYFKTKYAPYWKVAEDIKVTHKPRYFLNMNADNSLFSSKQDYYNVRTMPEEEKNKYVQQKLKESANKPQWYIPDEEKVTPTLIKSLSTDTKLKIICEAMILFPQDILKTKAGERADSDYSRISEYFISNYFYYSPSTRDLFSAGGREEIENMSLPKIINNFRSKSKQIMSILSGLNVTFLQKVYESWDELGIELTHKDIILDYKMVLDELGERHYRETLMGNKLSDIIFP